jgi:hypothetical protein
MNIIRPLAAAIALAWPLLVRADCYNQLRLDAFRPAPIRQVIVALDETTVLGESLTGDLIKSLTAAVRAGDRLTLIAFAGLTLKGHPRELFSVDMEAMPTAKVQDEMPVRRLRPLQACVEQSAARTRSAMQVEVLKALDGAAGGTYRTSEIVLSVREIGARFQASKVPEKLLLLVTDGAEHSGLMTFYSRKELRAIDPAAMLDVVAKQQLFADLAQARVYILGLGVAVGDQTRDQAVVLNLERFWLGFFQRSNSLAVAIGKPALLVPIE